MSSPQKAQENPQKAQKWISGLCLFVALICAFCGPDPYDYRD